MAKFLYPLIIGDKTINIEVTPKKIKNANLRFRRGQFYSSIPLRYPKNSMDFFFNSKKDWFVTCLEANSQKFIPNLDSFAINGAIFKLLYIDSDNFSFRTIDDQIIIFSRYKKEKAYQLLCEETTKEFLITLSSWLDIYCQKYNYKKPTLIIEKSRTRWGSYTKSKHLISINPLLAMTDIAHQKYVLFHEICHIDHQNHKPEFYQAVIREFPNYKQIRENAKKFTINY